MHRAWSESERLERWSWSRGDMGSSSIKLHFALAPRAATFSLCSSHRRRAARPASSSGVLDVASQLALPSAAQPSLLPQDSRLPFSANHPHSDPRLLLALARHSLRACLSPLPPSLLSDVHAQVPPRDQPSIQAELARLRAERRAKAAQAIEEGKEARASFASARAAPAAAAAATPAASGAAPVTASAPAGGLGKWGGLVRPSDLRHGLSSPTGVARESESEAQKLVRREYWRRVAEGRNV